MRCLALVLLLLAPLLLPLASAATVSQPRWTLGDEWTYAIAVVENGQTVQTGERHIVVTARGPFTYQGSSRETVTLTTWQNLSGDGGHSWADIRDASTGALLATQSGAQTFTAAQPCHEIQYPLEFPKGWTVECDLGSGPVETFYSVAGAERLTLPAGTFDTLSVDAVGNDAVRMWFADAGCGKVAEFSQTNDRATYVNLTALECTPIVSTTPTATPTGTPAGTTPATATPRTTPARTTYEYTCPPGTSHDRGNCMTSDADGDGSIFGLEQSRGTDPNDADTDDDGVRDNDDMAPLTAGANDNRSANETGTREGAPGLGVGAIILALALVALRRKPS